jgi:hypothetical protein
MRNWGIDPDKRPTFMEDSCYLFVFSYVKTLIEELGVRVLPP